MAKRRELLEQVQGLHSDVYHLNEAMRLLGHSPGRALPRQAVQEWRAHRVDWASGTRGEELSRANRHLNHAGEGLGGDEQDDAPAGSMARAGVTEAQVLCGESG
jgi:hypothetical protein